MLVICDVAVNCVLYTADCPSEYFEGVSIVI